MSYQTLKDKITQVCDKTNTLKTDIANINNAFVEKGVEVGDTPSEEYGTLLDEVFNNEFVNIFKEKTDFSAMFYNCTSLTSIPELDTSNGTKFNSMFYKCTSLTSIPELDTSNGAGFTTMFYKCTSLTSIPELDTSNGTGFSAMFYNCTSLTSIPKLDISNGTTISNIFNYCSALENLTIEGTIPYSISLQYSPLLTVESLLSIINALKDLTGSTSQTLTIGDANIAKLTAEQLQMIEDKNWTYK